MAQKHKTDWYRFTVVFATSTFVAFLIGKMAPALPTLTRSLDISLFQAGMLVATVSLISATLAIPIGIFMQRVGILRCCVFALILSGLAGILGALADGFMLLLLSRIIEGCSLVVCFIGMPLLAIFTSLENDQPLTMGIWSGFLPLGMAIIILISPQVIDWVDWQGLWLLIALSHVLFAGILWLSFHSDSPAKAIIKFSFSVLNRPLWKRGLIFMLYSIPFITFMTFFVTYLVNDLNMSILEASKYNAMVVVMNWFGSILAGILYKRKILSERMLYIIGFTTIMLTMPLFFWPESTFMLKIGVATLLGLVSGFVPGGIYIVLSQLTPNKSNQPIASAFIVQGAGLGQLLGPLIFTAAAQAVGGWYNASYFALLFIVPGMIIAWTVTKPQSQPKTQ